LLLPACSDCTTFVDRAITSHVSGVVHQDEQAFPALQDDRQFELEQDFSLGVGGQNVWQVAVAATLGVESDAKAPSFVVLAAPDGFIAAIADRPLATLDGTELALGQTFTADGMATVQRWDLSPDGWQAPIENASTTVTFAVDVFGKPQLPDDLDGEDFTTPPFGTLHVTSTVTMSLGTFVVDGSATYGVTKQTSQQCPQHTCPGLLGCPGD
jgi:hypothetical protein